MSEREYRSQIAAVLAEIESKARRLGRKMLLPAALGAGLALGAGGCSDDDNYVPTPDAVYGVDAALVDAFVPGPDAAYGVPFDMRVGDTAPAKDAVPDANAREDGLVPGPDAAYMGPDAN
jgi:hypothetical protein